MRLRIKAPFATFRTFTAGWFRPSAMYITPSAAYGLLLNLAGIESRYDDEKSAMTLMKPDLPVCEIALGMVSEKAELVEEQTLYQQVHNYPVGSSGKESKDDCKGNKYNIQPVRRGFLTNIDGYIVIRNNPELEKKIRTGLQHGLSSLTENNQPRYGVPFLGDNNFMIDFLREENGTLGTLVKWLYRADLKSISNQPRLPEEFPLMQRMPVWIDRQDMTKTISTLIGVQEEPDIDPPDMAWFKVGPQ
ncbi:MAG: CRISPR-associated protein Cas5 [Cyanobacteria bacterium]|nr:CRISPR-associated protein Cas5 [Cyanobacteriota bacterium]